jgi:AcrR family transcriptional regulator
VLEAAKHEFATHGYHAASTAAIAKAAGISQPYIYALFPNKRELFLAAHDQVVSTLRTTFTEAARGAEDPAERLYLMGCSYRPLIEGDPDGMLLQMQAYAAAGDPEIGPAVAERFQALYDQIRFVSGASEEEVSRLFSCGMLINVTTALGLPHIAEAMMDSVETAA